MKRLLAAGAVVSLGMALAPQIGAYAQIDMSQGPVLSQRNQGPAAGNVIPADTQFEVQLKDTLDTRKDSTGKKFKAKLAQDLVAPDGTITEYHIRKGSGPYGITTGPDGNIWFTERYPVGENGDTRIGKLTPDGQLTEYFIAPFVQPWDITTGPDGETEYIVYHAWDKAMKMRQMCIDKLDWTTDGPRCDAHGHST